MDTSLFAEGRLSNSDLVIHYTSIQFYWIFTSDYRISTIFFHYGNKKQNGYAEFLAHVVREMASLFL